MISEEFMRNRQKKDGRQKHAETTCKHNPPNQGQREGNIRYNELIEIKKRYSNFTYATCCPFLNLGA